jgi:hypothetical protein
MPDEKKLFIDASVIEAYRAGLERGRQLALEELLWPIFAGYARAERDTHANIPTILAVPIVAAQMRCAMSTPAQRLCAAGFPEHDHAESITPRPE